MVLFIWAIFKMIYLIDKEYCIIQIKTSIKEKYSMEKNMEMASITLIMVISIKDNLKMIKDQEKVIIYFLYNYLYRYDQFVIFNGYRHNDIRQ